MLYQQHLLSTTAGQHHQHSRKQQWRKNQQKSLLFHIDSLTRKQQNLFQIYKKTQSLKEKKRKKKNEIRFKLRNSANQTFSRNLQNIRDEETHTCPGDGGAEITIVLQIEKFNNLARDQNLAKSKMHSMIKERNWLMDVSWIGRMGRWIVRGFKERERQKIKRAKTKARSEAKESCLRNGRRAKEDTSLSLLRLEEEGGGGGGSGWGSCWCCWCFRSPERKWEEGERDCSWERGIDYYDFGSSVGGTQMTQIELCGVGVAHLRSI